MGYLAALALLLLLAPPSEGLTFLKITNVIGSSIDARHPGEIDVLGWSSSLAATQATGGTGVGKVVFKDLKFRKRVDKSSPTLFTLVVTAKPSAEAILTERREGANPVEYYKIRLTDVVVSSITTAPPTPGAVPEEEITLRFNTYQVSFTGQKPTGGLETPVCSCWNKLLGTGCACQAAG